MSVDLNDFQNDFEFLKELRNVLKSFLKSSELADEKVKREGIFSKLADGRSIRIVLPHGCKILTEGALDNDLHFVGFLGFAKPKDNVPKSTLDKLWNIDSRLVNEFQSHPNILAYVTAEKGDMINWGNLVLLSSSEAITKWRSCDVHKEAVGEISPSYYSKVRIHRGLIQNGEHLTEQTIFVDYATDPISRIEKIWTQ